jgi:type I restriction enzyme S subunit
LTRQAKLGDFLAKRSRGIVPASSPSETFELYSVPAFESRRPEVVAGSEIGSNKQMVDPGTVLLCKINPRINRAWTVGSFTKHQKIASTEWITFPPHADLEPRYLAHYLSRKEIRDYLAANASGVGGSLMRVKASTVEDLPLLLPIVDEQRRIVAEIEKQLSRLEEAVANLQRVKANLRRYVAVTLHSAFAGKLVPTEAELARQHCRSFEPGSELLARLNSSRDSRKSKTVAAPPTSFGGPAIQGWTWTNLGECFKVSVGATPSRKEPTYWGGSVPWVSSGEVQFSRISRTNESITEAGLANSSTQINPAGSVLLGMIGQGRTRGQAAILDIPAANNQNCAAIWVSRTPVPPEFVFYWLMSRYEQTREEGSGNNQQALNKSLVEAIPLPVPPLAEQHRIVAEVDRRLSIVREVDTEVDANLERAHRLRSAVLVHAFETAAPSGAKCEGQALS